MADKNYNRKIISRVQARKKGLTKYYTGKQCQNGHKAQRYVSTNLCVTCQTGTPVIQDHLLTLAKASAKIRGIKIQTYSMSKEIAIINS